MSDVQTTVQDIEKKADELGVDVIWPLSDELFLDIDSEWAFVAFQKGLTRLNEYFATVSFNLAFVAKDTPSRSGMPGKRHIVVKLPRDVKDETERLLLQAVLGSDPIRELVGWVRLEHAPDHRPTVFFEKRKEENLWPDGSKVYSDNY